jgi:hypothetical protein
MLVMRLPHSRLVSFAEHKKEEEGDLYTLLFKKEEEGDDLLFKKDEEVDDPHFSLGVPQEVLEGAYEAQAICKFLQGTYEAQAICK